MLKKLRIKFVCINMLLLTVLLCVILGLVLHFTRANLEAESLRMLQTAASRPGGPDGPERPPEEAYLPCFTVQLDRRGGLLVSGGGYYDLTDETLLYTLVEQALASPQPFGVLEEYGLRFFRGAHALAFTDVSSELAAMSHLTRTCVLAGGAGFFALLFISVFLAHWAVKPVERAWEQQKQFVADASHELKTPLTVLITNGELLLDPGVDPRTHRQLAGNMLTMARQMHGLTAGLLELARADQAETVRSRVDLSQLTADALLPFEAVFFERGLLLTDRIEDGLLVRGSALRLRQVVDVLLDNARKYSAPQGEVTVVLGRRGRGRCRLEVSSPGEAIPREALKDIFRRFYRLDQARSMDHSYGLGLSIAQTIVEQHHGKIWAESGGGRNTFFVELPAE